MGPKAFITCYVCCREFGSRSIPFHEPKCLERWRSFNRNLPPEKRSHTPVKPIGWKYSTESTWVCTNCSVTVPAAKRGEHAAQCFSNTKSKEISSDRSPDKSIMTVDKGSPRKGKENKNNTNQVNSKNLSNNVSKEGNNAEKNRNVSNANNSNNKPKVLKEGVDKKVDNSPESQNTSIESPTKGISTSNRSVRPQTKILRRPTPNLKHPVIQVDSDETSDSQEKIKDDNPKRMKTNDEARPKNFIIYNKYNVEKNIKNSPKERSSASKESTTTAGTGIPHPCYSCSRSVAPERLHSHARRDSRGLMLKKMSSVENKQSPQKKIPEGDDKKCRDSKSDDDRGHRTHKSHEKNDKGRSLSVNGHSPSKKMDSQRASSHVCRICRREFDASSLPVHENNCLERWKKENEPNRQKSAQKKLEPNGKGDNSDPSWQVVQAQLVPCPSCGRTFFPERLPIHQRVCKGKSNPNSLSRNSSFREQSSQQCDEDGDKPIIYVPCYICSRSFGSWVIQMHESQCLRKWRRENERLPEHLQHQEPHKPQLVLSDDGQIDWDATDDDVAWESHLQQLVPCPRCGRTFFPDRLQVHGRSCKGPPNSRHPRSNKGA